MLLALNGTPTKRRDKTAHTKQRELSSDLYVLLVLLSTLVNVSGGKCMIWVFHYCIVICVYYCIATTA